MLRFKQRSTRSRHLADIAAQSVTQQVKTLVLGQHRPKNRSLRSPVAYRVRRAPCMTHSTSILSAAFVAALGLSALVPTTAQADIGHVGLEGGTLMLDDGDIELGQYERNSIYSGVKILKSGTYDTVRVTLRRDGEANARLPLHFARVLGFADTEVVVSATAVLAAADTLSPSLILERMV